MNFDVILATISVGAIIIVPTVWWFFNRKSVKRTEAFYKRIKKAELLDEKESLLFRILEIDEELASLDNEAYNT